MPDSLLPRAGAKYFDGISLYDIITIIEGGTWALSTDLYRVYFVSDSYYSYAEKLSVNHTVDEIVYDNTNSTSNTDILSVQEIHAQHRDRQIFWVLLSVGEPEPEPEP